MRQVLLLLVLLLAFVGGASATDYYVATWGDNTTQGNLTHPWQNVSYAAQQAVAGDTIYLINGTWYEEDVNFANSGNSTHPIVMTAYNGTPTMISNTNIYPCIDASYRSYINVSDIKIKNYGWGVGMDGGGSHCHFSDMILEDTGSYAFFLTNAIFYVTIDNCTIHGNSWNTIQFSGHNALSHNLSITNCVIYDNTGHNYIDLNCGYGLEHIDIIGNTIIGDLVAFPTNGIFSHNYEQGVYPKYLNISNNVIHDTLRGIYTYLEGSGSIIYNNTFYDNSNYDILGMGGTGTIYRKNTFNTEVDIGGTSVLFDQNIVTSLKKPGGSVTVRDTDKKVYLVRSTESGDVTVEYTDGRVFQREITSNNVGTASAPRWYPTGGNFTMDSTPGTNGITVRVTAYNITFQPTSAYLHSLTMNHESDVSDDRTNISIDSSVSNNPTWINTTMQNASNTYNVSVDGGDVGQVVSDSDGVVRYQYTSSWSSHSFEFDWYSDAGFAGAPDPTNLQTTTGTSWVNHTWAAGSGNITDSYNVSINLVWHNITINDYYNNTGMSPESWSNITVWAYNNTGGISQNSISQNTQSDATPWSPSNTTTYFNNTSPIEITTKTDGTNRFSRTPTEADSVTSFKLVVTV